MTTSKQKIIYTITDEAPALATASLLPIIRSFTAAAGVNVDTSDISVAARILANFPENLTPEQQVPDTLAELGELTQDPDANIIKLPNISASIPQLKAAIKELQSQGYNIPDFPDEPKTDEEKSIRTRYGKILGSAVNPVLREGNSDRRAPAAVKAYVRKHPHSMGAWSKASKSHADWMRDGDFFSTEQSITTDKAGDVRIEFVDANGNVEVKKTLPLEAGEILDSTVMSAKKLEAFLEQSIEEAKADDVMWSLHVKATMMKVSDPVIFGHAVKVFFKDVFEKYGELFKQIGVNPNNGLSSLYDHIKTLPEDKQQAILDDIDACYAARPEIAMVNSDKGITNLHVPSDVIIDASMPAMIRNSGRMWGRDGQPKDTKAVMPDRSYARIYQETINFCKTNGAFDPTTMGTVQNVGLMAKKAEEYGSHDKTFIMTAAGTMRVVCAETDKVLMEHAVEEGDIWRACQTKDAPVKDWVKLAVNRARQSGFTTIFWLDPERAHDRNVQKKVELYLKDHDLEGLDIRIMDYNAAIRESMERAVRGENTISVTGNVLRDYLTDLFPIMELGTSAKMLSIVPLMAGGGMYETGAGGSAPKHVQQLQEENHLRWDSLGEFLAMSVSLEEMGIKYDNLRAKVLGKTLDAATGKVLDNNKSPSRKVGELDNRGSHFYLAMYWAEELANQTDDVELASHFKDIARELEANEEKIVAELAEVQGQSVDLGGYYYGETAKIVKVMRPSTTFNSILEKAFAKA